MDRLPNRHRSRRELLKTPLAAITDALAAPIVGRLPTASALAGPVTPGTGSDSDVLFAELDEFVAQSMAELRIPGAAIGVIAGDREHAMGFGVTNVDHPLPIDTDTLFQIGSTTKTFTGTVVMRLV
jgi:CubicO group peptidase (beta-lactamase class C family)